MEPQRKSVFRYAAEQGPWMGLWLLAASAALFATPSWPDASVIALLLTAATPAVLLALLRRIRRREPAYSGFWAQWTAGIYIFIFGGLICALGNAAWLIAGDPGFLSDYSALMLRNASALAQGDPELQTQISLMTEALQRQGLPSPMQYVMSMLWSTAFFGSILALAAALAGQIKPRPRYRIK